MQIIFSKKVSRVDEQIEIKIIEITSDEKVIIEAQMNDEYENCWSSQAVFYTYGSNEINLSEAKSIEGSYKGIEPMGLFWSMSCKEAENCFYTRQLKPLEYKITACCGQVKDEITIKRIFVNDDVQIERIDNNLIQGTYISHKYNKSKGTIILFGGSEGSNDMVRAGTLAGHGYNVFACYFFGVGSLPKELVRVPLEFFDEVLEFIRERNLLEKMPLTIIGSSRGAELGLLLGTIHKEIDQIILFSGSSYVFQGLSRECLGSSWSIKGREVPYIDFYSLYAGILMFISSFKKGPNNFIKYYKSIIKKERRNKDKRIKAELFKGRLALISGSKDELWPSEDMAHIINKYRNIPELENKTINYNYSEAGHVFQIPYLPMLPIATRNYVFGGTIYSNFKASEDSHFKILKLLDDTNKIT